MDNGSRDVRELLDELAAVATRTAPAVRPVAADRLLMSIARAGRELFGARACSLALLTEDQSELVYTTAAGEGADDVTGLRLPSGRGIAGWVVMSGQPVAVADLSADPRFARDVAEQTGYVPTALLAVPLVGDDDEVLGVLTLLDRDDDRPGAEQDMALLSVLAEQAALTLQNERAATDLGRLLLQALSAAASPGSDLAEVLADAAERTPAPDADLAALAAAFALLERQGPRERRLAVALVREVSTYTGSRSRPRP